MSGKTPVVGQISDPEEYMMHFFLQGDQGMGKSHLLREVLKPYVSMITGFTVQRLFEDSTLVGFRAYLFAGEFPALDLSYRSELDGIFLYRNKQNVRALEHILGQVERCCLTSSCRLILLDEIGGMELLSPLFMESLTKILEGVKPCVGVLKSRRNLKHMVDYQRLDSSCLLLHKNLEELILSKGVLAELTQNNRRQLEKQLKRYLKSISDFHGRPC